MPSFELPDMTCGHCVKAVTQTLQRLDPVAQLKIDLPTHRVEVDSQLPREQLAAALAGAGYTPR